MISVAMTTYNGEKYIEQQIDSILSQSIQDFELVICDDNSKDNTFNILKSYSKKYPRIRIFKNNENLGFRKNFEKVITQCNGEYIALSDQDDIWEKDHLELLLNIIKDNNVACGNSIMLYENNYIKSRFTFLNEVDNLFIIPENKNLMLYRLLCKGGTFAGHDFLIKTSFLKETILPFPEEIAYHDYWISICAILFNSFAYTFKGISQYRQHGNNVTCKEGWNAINSLKRSIKLILKIEKTESINYRANTIDIINKRFKTTPEQSDILNQCALFLKMRMNISTTQEYRTAKKIFWKNYKDIYTQKTNKFRLVRLLEILAERKSR